MPHAHAKNRRQTCYHKQHTQTRGNAPSKSGFVIPLDELSGEVITKDCYHKIGQEQLKPRNSARKFNA